MAVTLDAPVSQLDPLWLTTCLLEKVDNTVVVCDVNGGLASQKKVGNLVNLRKLAGGFNLKVAVTMSQSLVTNRYAFKFCGRMLVEEVRVNGRWVNLPEGSLTGGS